MPNKNSLQVNCPLCGGAGRDIQGDCFPCKGSGRMWLSQYFNWTPNRPVEKQLHHIARGMSALSRYLEIKEEIDVEDTADARVTEDVEEPKEEGSV